MHTIDREKLHRELHDGNGPIIPRVRELIKKYALDITVNSLDKSYRRWVDKLTVESVKPAPQLAKLDNHIGDFTNMINELIPQEANPLDLPPSQESNYKPFKLPVNHNNILLLSDIHVPYHNIQALTLALKYGLENEVNTILLNGDIIDFYAISRFEKDPRKRNFAADGFLLN